MLCRLRLGLRLDIGLLVHRCPARLHVLAGDFSRALLGYSLLESGFAAASLGALVAVALFLGGLGRREDLAGG